MTLKQAIEQYDTTAGKSFDFFIQGLIIVSLVSFSIKTLSDLQPGIRQLLVLPSSSVVTPQPACT